jgi:hypothetical protein
MYQKQLILELLKIELPTVIELFNEVSNEFKSATKYEIRSKSKNYQETFKKGQHNWSYLYLEPNRLYLDLKPIGQLIVYEKLKGLSEEQIKALEPIEFVTGLMNEFMPETEPKKAFEEYQRAVNSDNPDEKFFTDLLIARFFNNLSYADHKEHIPKLLYDLLKNDKLENIRKAVAIDPTIRYLPEIESYISNSNDYNQSLLRGYIAQAMDDYFLTNGKNHYSPSLFLFIATLGLMGLLDGDITLDIDEIFIFAQEHNLDFIESNPDRVLEKAYLKKLVKQFLDGKVKESEINFDFLTN